MLTNVDDCDTLLHMRKETHIGFKVGDELLQKIDRFKKADHRDSRSATVRVILEKYFEEHPEIRLDESDKT